MRFHSLPPHTHHRESCESAIAPAVHHLPHCNMPLQCKPYILLVNMSQCILSFRLRKKLLGKMQKYANNISVAWWQHCLDTWKLRLQKPTIWSARYKHNTLAYLKSVKKCWITGVGITYPMFSASLPARDWNAMPTHSPTSLNTGPPAQNKRKYCNQRSNELYCQHRRWPKKAC